MLVHTNSYTKHTHEYNKLACVIFVLINTCKGTFLIPQFPASHVWCTWYRVPHCSVHGISECVRVWCILEVIIVCNGGICFWGPRLSKSEWWLCGCLCPYLFNFCFVWNSAPVICLVVCLGEWMWLLACLWASAPFFPPYIFCSFTHGNLKWFHCQVSTYCMLSYKTHKAKQSSLHKEDPISHMCELKLRILLCSVFWAVLKCFTEELKWKHGMCV